MEAINISFRRWMDTLVIHPYKGILFSSKKKWAIKPPEDMEEPQMQTATRQQQKAPHRVIPTTAWHFRKGETKDSTNISGCQGFEEKTRGWISRRRGVNVAKPPRRVVWWWRYVLTCFLKLTEHTTTDFHQMIMYQCWCISRHTCTTLMRVIDNRGNWKRHLGRRAHGSDLYFPVNLFYKLSAQKWYGIKGTRSGDWKVLSSKVCLLGCFETMMKKYQRQRIHPILMIWIAHFSQVQTLHLYGCALGCSSPPWTENRNVRKINPTKSKVSSVPRAWEMNIGEESLQTSAF